MQIESYKLYSNYLGWLYNDQNPKIAVYRKKYNIHQTQKVCKKKTNKTLEQFTKWPSCLQIYLHNCWKAFRSYFCDESNVTWRGDTCSYRNKTDRPNWSDGCKTIMEKVSFIEWNLYTGYIWHMKEKYWALNKYFNSCIWYDIWSFSVESWKVRAFSKQIPMAFKRRFKFGLK